MQVKLQVAAGLVGATLNQFVVQAALEKAEKVSAMVPCDVLRQAHDEGLFEGIADKVMDHWKGWDAPTPIKDYSTIVHLPLSWEWFEVRSASAVEQLDEEDKRPYTTIYENRLGSGQSCCQHASTWRGVQ